MKQIFVFLIALSVLVACTADQPKAPQLDTTIGQLALSKIVAVGNSITAGFQSSGMMEDYQKKSYGYLVAKQLGVDYQQPLISAPGIGSTSGQTPQMFDPATGAIYTEALTVNPLTLLANAYLSRPYDNLGVPGADLNDVLNTKTAAESGNPFFDMILRNPNMGNTTQLEQAIMLRPTLLMLWIGNNDALGAALAGGDLTQLTSQADFQSRMTSILTKLRTELTSTVVVMGTIPYVTDIPYVNTCDIIFRDLGAGAMPVMFDATFQPIDFGGGMMLPIMTEETAVTHITLPGLIAYQSGLGVPNAAALQAAPYNLDATTAGAIEAGLIAAGLTPSGQPIPGTMTLTATEEQTIKESVDGFNTIIATLANTFQVPVVNANAKLAAMNTAEGYDGVTGRFVLLDPVNTGFSLDGVHPNDAGHAIIANSFIEVLNNLPAPLDDINIPMLDVSAYKGQYLGSAAKLDVNSAVENVKAIFVK
jgi:hypothetical protein